MSHSKLAYTICTRVYSRHRTKKVPKQGFLHTIIIELFETAEQHVTKPDICQLFNI